MKVYSRKSGPAMFGPAGPAPMALQSCESAGVNTALLVLLLSILSKVVLIIGCTARVNGQMVSIIMANQIF